MRRSAIGLLLAILSPAAAREVAPAPVPLPAPAPAGLPPGHYPGEELITVGRRKFQIVRRGHGHPTVVFEDGLGGSIGGMLGVMAAVADTTSAVAYARAGYGASDPVAGPRTVAAIAEDLHGLLRQAGLAPPYVLVGYSVGALYVRGFALKYPDEVGGLVLVDGTPERYLLDLQKIDPDGATRSLRRLAQSNADGFPDLAGSPGPQGEWQGLYPIVASGQLGVPGSLPDVPMVVISGLRPDGPGAREAAIARMKREEHSLLFQATTRGMHLVTDRSGHDVMKREPELVVQAIAWVVREVRAER